MKGDASIVSKNSIALSSGGSKGGGQRGYLLS